MAKSFNDIKAASKGNSKWEAVSSAIQGIEKNFGKGSITKLGDGSIVDIGRIPSDIITLDLAIGGGLPKGRIIEAYGPESVGKTSLFLHWIGEQQKIGGVCAVIDAEHALDPSWAKKLGVNIKELLVAQPDSGEEALEVTESLVKSNAVDIILVDSTNSLVPKAELEGNMGDAQMGLQARLLSQALRKLTGAIAKSNTTVVFLSQIRQKIGVLFGSNEAVGVGTAMKFYASVRLDIRKIETLKKGDEPYGNRLRVKVVKNKTAPPFRQAEFNLLFEGRYDKEEAIIDVATKLNIIDKSGSWFSFEGNRMQGKDNVANFLRDNPTIYAQIKEKVYSITEQDTNIIENITETVSPIGIEIDMETGEIIENANQVIQDAVIVNSENEIEIELTDKSAIEDQAPINKITRTKN